MKKGFALLETLMVITILTVSLLMLYGTFSNMVNNSKKNIYYDDASNIYKIAFLKEYLEKYNLSDLIDNEDIKEISCSSFSFDSCVSLLEKMNINAMYIVRYELNNFDNEYSSTLNNYLSSLSNNKEGKHRLVVEFLVEENYAYASLEIEGEDHE